MTSASSRTPRTKEIVGAYTMIGNEEKTVKARKAVIMTLGGFEFNEELKNQLLRTAAEYDNYRKRSQREADQKFNDGVSHAVTQIWAFWTRWTWPPTPCAPMRTTRKAS